MTPSSVRLNNILPSDRRVIATKKTKLKRLQLSSCALLRILPNLGVKWNFHCFTFLLFVVHCMTRSRAQLHVQTPASHAESKSIFVFNFFPSSYVSRNSLLDLCGVEGEATTRSSFDPWSAPQFSKYQTRARNTYERVEKCRREVWRLKANKINFFMVNDDDVKEIEFLVFLWCSILGLSHDRCTISS